MTQREVEVAVMVLNRFKHRGCSQWARGFADWAQSEGGDQLFPFEAVAIAEKYLREEVIPLEETEAHRRLGQYMTCPSSR